ncbi:hypothetical protein ACE3G8_16900 [Vreelandella venusta]
MRAQQTSVRQQERRDVACNTIRFRQAPDRQLAVGDSITKLVLTSSYDRSANF